MNFLYTILGILVFILVLGVAVLIHEGGHFFFAKRAGILCHEFSIGMGPCLFQKKKGETVYSFRAIPIGGYVAMAGEEVEYDVLKGYSNIKLELDEKGCVKTLVLCMDNPKYKDLPTLKIGKYDLFGSADGTEELYICCYDEEGFETRYVVNRDAMLNYKKKEEIQIAPQDRLFSSKSLGKRFMAIFAGPMMNFVLALIVFFMMGLFFGYADTSSTKIDKVSGPAAVAGLEDNDVIHTINGEVLTTWDDLTVQMNKVAHGEGISSNGTVKVTYYKKGDVNSEITAEFNPQVMINSIEMAIDNTEANAGKIVVADLGDIHEQTKIGKAGILPGDVVTKVNGVTITTIPEILKYFTSDAVSGAKPVKISVLRNEEEKIFEVEPYSFAMLDASNLTQTRVTLGVSVGTSFNFLKLLYMPWVQTGESTMQIFKTLGLFFKKNTGIHITDLSGPVGIANLFINLVKGPDAFYQILYWTGLLSVNLGFINLLPLPALDGGRLVFLGYEAITKKKPNAKVENTIHNIGFMLFMALFVLIFISDIIRCF